MDKQPKAIRLVRLEEEALDTGRKLLHCVFEDYHVYHGYQPRSYRWTAPWRSKSRNYGVLQLFRKSHEVEEYNDFEGVWDEEFRKLAEEIPLLGEMKLPVEVGMGAAVEDIWIDSAGIPQDCWKVCINISRDEEDAFIHEEQGKQYLAIGAVNMAWGSLQHEIYQVKEVKFISDEMESSNIYDNAGYIIDTTGIYFWLWLKKTADKVQYQTTTRNISFHIRSFIRGRLSEYRSLKRGFEEQ
jgi:hypothetical protein